MNRDAFKDVLTEMQISEILFKNGYGPLGECYNREPSTKEPEPDIITYAIYNPILLDYGCKYINDDKLERRKTLI